MFDYSEHHRTDCSITSVRAIDVCLSYFINSSNSSIHDAATVRRLTSERLFCAIEKTCALFTLMERGRCPEKQRKSHGTSLRVAENRVEALCPIHMLMLVNGASIETH